MSFQNLFDDDLFSNARAHLPEHWSGPNLNPARRAYRARLRCWTLRILGGGADMPAYCESGTPRMSVLADLLDMPTLADPAATVAEVQLAIQAALAQVNTPVIAANSDIAAIAAQSDQTEPVSDCAMMSTIAWLSEQAGLDSVSRDLFEVVAAMRVFRPLRFAVSTWNNLEPGELPCALAVILNCPLPTVLQALDRDGLLVRSGLVRLNTSVDAVLDQLIRVPRHLAQRLLTHVEHPSLILSHLVVPMAQPTLCLQDFAYMKADTQLAHAWLAGALAASGSERRGAHMLVTGAPGLGKTQWVRALLAEFSGVDPI